MLDWFKPVSKALAGFLGAALAVWFAKKGLEVPTDVSAWINGAIDSLLFGLIGGVLTYFAPKNK